MLTEIEKIQKRVKGTGQKVAIVTFTVDPDFDKPNVLFELARKRKANPYVWTFLTGENKDEMFKLYRDGFKVGVEHDPKNLMDIAHSEKIVLVDGNNRVRGYYAFEEHSINKLMIDVGLLINRPSTKE
jgi:protein SCO1/2